jgi:hypothetical protein
MTNDEKAAYVEKVMLQVPGSDEPGVDESGSNDDSEDPG